MNSRLTVVSTIVTLTLASLLNLAAYPSQAAAFPRTSRASIRDSLMDQTDYPINILDYDIDDDLIDQQSNNQLDKQEEDDLEELLMLANEDKTSTSAKLLNRLNKLGLLSSSTPGSSSVIRQMEKRHICEYHGVCERCAKHTKSHEVYSQCCRNEDGRKWCNDFLNYQMGRK